MTIDLPRSHGELPAAIKVPEDAVAVLLSGSAVVGWANPTSDIDVYVVTRSPAVLTGYTGRLATAGAEVGVVVTHDPTGRRYDAEYWTVDQIEALLERIQVADAAADSTYAALSYAEADVLYRITVARALVGEGWLHKVSGRIQSSALPFILAGRELFEADGLIEDAVGMLEAQDTASAVLAARTAFGRVVDGYLYAQGSLAPNAKWRYRKLQDLCDRSNSPALDLETYWRVETMRELDARDPTPWVRSTLALCQDLVMTIDFAPKGN